VHGESFVHHHDPAGDLAARDRVARAIVLESERTGSPVFLTLAHLPAAFVHQRFPAVADLCRRAGLDLAADRLPVGPAAHYLMGGVATDLDGRTSIPGLFAAGEAACTGVHGANRLASNSLLEGLVFGGRAGRAMRTAADGRWPTAGAAPAETAEPGEDVLEAPLAEADVRALMWRRAGVFRDRQGLEAARHLLEPARRAVEARLLAGATMDAAAWRQISLLTVGALIVQAALAREESRGAHSRTDFPDRDDVHWKRRLFSGGQVLN
jgi:L-aspartate oxidase